MPIVFKTEEERNPTNKTTIVEVDNTTQSGSDETMELISENDLSQIVYSEGEEGQLAIQFLEENGLYQKFLLWQGIQEQLKNLKSSLVTPTE